ncbi:MAG: glycoside hydrolase family 25 protein [Polyangiaceae bacterium]
MPLPRYPTLGCDVSSHQPTSRVPWRRLVAERGVSFMFARAGLGIGKDAAFLSHVDNARAGGVALTGGYWVVRPARRVDPQVDLFVGQLEEAGGELFQVADIELIDGMGPKAAANRLLEFCDRVEARTGRVCSIYSYGAFLAALKLGEGFAKRPLLLAKYGGTGDPTPPAPWSHVTVHQFDGDGGERAPNGLDLDFDGSYRSLEELRAILLAPVGR